MTNRNSEFTLGQIVQKNGPYPEFFEVTEIHETHTVVRSLSNGYPEAYWHESEYRRFIPAESARLFEEYHSASADTNKFSRLYTEANSRKHNYARAYQKLTGTDVADVPVDGADGTTGEN